MLKNLIIIPTFNEAGNLDLLSTRIREIDVDSHVLIVDDNSPDGTGRIADEIAKRDQRFHVLHRAGKLGIGSAHVAGLKYAREHGFETALTMDCDFTHKPEYLPQLRRKLEAEDFDVAVGSRYIQQDALSEWTIHRKVITHVAHFLTVTMLGMKFDATNGLRVYRVSRLPYDKIEAIRADGYGFMFEMLFVCHLHGLRIGQLPVELPQRHAGYSKISKAEVFKAVIRLFALSARRVGYLLKRDGHAFRS